MKKTILALVFVIFLTSCDSKDDNILPTSSPPVLAAKSEQEAFLEGIFADAKEMIKVFKV